MKAKYTPVPGQIVSSIPWKGRYLIIRHIKKSDWLGCWEYINTLSAERTFILYQGDHISQRYEIKHINNAVEELKKQKAILLLLINRKKIVGISGIALKSSVHKHVGTIGISVEKNYRDGGLGTQFLNVLLVEGKRSLPGLSIATLEVFENNPRAIHLYEKLGFKTYGRLPKGLNYQNEYKDSILMYKTI